MSAIGPAGEKIARNLQEAVERLHDDIARVELWAGALGCFAKPVPEYDPSKSSLNKFLLPRAERGSSERDTKKRNNGRSSHGISGFSKTSAAE